MDTLITIVQNDYGFDLNFTLKDAVGAVVNLTGSTLTFIGQLVNDNSVTFTGSMTIISAVGGTCKYTVQSTDFTIAGQWNGQITVNYSSSTEIVSFSGININVVAKLPVS